MEEEEIIIARVEEEYIDLHLCSRDEERPLAPQIPRPRFQEREKD